MGRTPAAAEYPAEIPNFDIQQQEWSWATGKQRAVSIVAGQITGTTLCDLHGATPVIAQAELDKVKSYLTGLWKAPPTAPAPTAPFAVAGAAVQSMAFDCGATPYFMMNGAVIKPDYILAVHDSTSVYDLNIRAVSLSDGTVMGALLEFPIDPQAGTVSPTPRTNQLYAANISKYTGAPISAAYMEGVISALTAATFLMETGSNPPAGVYFQDSTPATVGVGRFRVVPAQ